MIANDMLFQWVKQSLGFVVPKEDEIDALLADNDLYREYGLALAWMQDYLVGYSSLPFHRRTPKSESKTYIQEVLSSDLMKPLVDNFVKNQAIILRFSEIAEANTDSESIKSLIDNFLNEMADFRIFLREAQKNGDKESLTAMYTKQKSAETEAFKAQLQWLKNNVLKSIFISSLKFQPEELNELEDEAILLPEY